MREKIIHILYNLKEKAFVYVIEAESTLNRIILFSLLIIILVWINLNQVIELLVSENAIKNNLIKKLEQVTGKPAHIDGAISFKSEPEPVIIMQKTKVDNTSTLTKESMFEAEVIRTKPDILSAILGKIDFNSIYFEDITLNLDLSDEKSSIYEKMKQYFSSEKEFIKKKIVIKNLKINFYKANPLNPSTPIVRTYTFPQLVFEFSPEKEVLYRISGITYLKALRQGYNFSFDMKDLNGKDIAYNAKIYSESSDIRFSGKINTQDKITFSGDLSGKVVGFAKGLFASIGFSEKILESLRDSDENQVSAKYNYDGNKFEIIDFKNEGREISLVLNSKTEIKEKTSTNVEINVSKFLYNKLFKTDSEISSEKKAKRVERDLTKNLEDYFLFTISDDVNFNFSLSAPTINFFHDRTGGLSIKASLNDNQFKIDDLKATLPGDSVLSFVSLMEINKLQKQMKGSSRIIFSGKNLDEFYLAINSYSEPLKDQRFGPFFLDAQGFLYGKNIHFRNITGRVNDDKFSGQMMIDYSKDINSSAAFNFSSLNLDKYLPNNTASQQSDIAPAGEANIIASKLDFLRSIDSIFDRLDISMVAEKVVKADYNYNDFSLYAQIAPGVTEIKNIYFDSDLMGEVSGNAHLDLTDFQPKMNVDLEIEKYDANLMIYGKPLDNTANTFNGSWSTEPISFEKIGSFQGKLNLKVKELKVDRFLMNNFKIVSHTEEGRFVIDQSRVDIFGSKIDFKGYLTTEFPSFSISFIADDMDFKKFMAGTLGFKQITSIFNISGVASSTGYSIEQIMQNLQGNFALATKGFSITGFDLIATGKALKVAKRREYIKLIADTLLNKGETFFSFFTGSFYIEKGIISFYDMPINGPQIDSSKISGEIDLPKWQANIKSYFSIDVAGNNKAFPLRAETTGKIPELSTKWDTKGMMDYWEDEFFNYR